MYSVCECLRNHSDFFISVAMVMSPDHYVVARYILKLHQIVKIIFFSWKNIFDQLIFTWNFRILFVFLNSFWNKKQRKNKTIRFQVMKTLVNCHQNFTFTASLRHDTSLNCINWVFLHHFNILKGQNLLEFFWESYISLLVSMQGWREVGGVVCRRAYFKSFYD